MRRSLTIKLLAGLVGFTALATLAGTAAWFIPTATINSANTPIEGETLGAYFAYGDGTAEQPYGITKPRHVYNLAWLQYLGMFNKVDNPNSPYYGRQFHFEVAADVDMGGMVIPPIGTTEYPFVGELKGQNHIISGFETSNSFADYNKRPAAVNSGNFKNNVVKIVGFFGVVGNYENQFSGQGIVYNNAVNTINDLGLTDFTVTTVASDTLIGMAAGWVGATINNIAVDTGTINVEAANAAAFNGGSVTKRLSDYSIVGYSASKQKLHRYSDTVYNVSTTVLPDSFTVDEQSSSAGWGGSLDMVQMYNDLFSVWDTFSGASGT
ncbi:MAG: hypothetical protein K6E59_02620, partial [Bacilli bacterium]|nr:hypothetical protein [Bacilli bacterium]